MSFHDVKAATIEFARGFNHGYYQPLHIAILKGDWESTKAFLDNDPSALTAKITTIGRSALHVAAVGGQWQLVEKLVQLVPVQVLAELDLMGCTCLHYVAMGESINAAKALLAKDPSLTQLTDFTGFTPLIYSITSRCKEMVWYLVLNTTDEEPGRPFSGPSANQLVALLTAAGFHDITMYLLQCYPNLATLSDSKGSIILNVLSKLPSYFQSGNKLGFWKRFIYHCVPVGLDYLPPSHLRGNLKDSYGDSSHQQSYFGGSIWNAIQNIVPGIKLVREAKLRHSSAVRLVKFVCTQVSTTNDTQLWQSFVSGDIVFNATSSGIVEFLRICFQIFPDLVWTRMPNEGFVAQIAIKNRQEKVFSLLCKMPIICKFLVLALDESQNTTSHLAARFASPQLASVSGAVFQMQKELQWFKEVEKWDHPLHKEVKNQDDKTPWQLFREEHKPLLEEAKNWMKDTSNSCMVVAALIATVVFAASITVPGGNNQDKGFPIYLSNDTFMVFVVSDALALFSSMASLLMFLSILTANYAEEDFLKRLPERIILGLASLFFSIVTTMVAFGAALDLLLEERLKWVSIPIALLACVPVALFAKLQLPLFIQMIISTYGSRMCHHHSLW
ncbi:Ankyrin repeat-containing protein [Spatholobus suberectus]|nr:Ankyrin repeat-containing protein [Spatholobus suberectus]